MVVKTAVVNELGTHLDLLDQSKRPGQVFRMVYEDVGLGRSFFRPDQPIVKFQMEELPKPKQRLLFTLRAMQARKEGSP